MFRQLNQWSRGRSAWLLLASAALALELMALGFQYFLHLQPCVLCVYQRAAVAGVMLSGLLGVIAPGTPLRFVSISGWIAAAGYTLSLAWEQTLLQLHPPLFATCDFAARFPSWMPLNKMLPVIFSAVGDCSERSWTLFHLSLSQYLAGISAALLLLGVLVLIAQLPCFSAKR